MRIIAIANQKGGCGKTTTAINLSSSLAKHNRRVLLLDMDPQGHATLGYDIHPDEVKLSIFNVLLEGVPTDDVILNTKVPYVNLIPSNIYLSTAEQVLAGVPEKEKRLYNALAQITRPFDYIIIDCPPNLGLLSINALRAANEVIIPVDAGFFSLQGLGRLLETIDMLENLSSHRPETYILPTMFSKRSRFAREILDEIGENYEGFIYSTPIRLCTKLKESVSFGSPVNQYAKNSIGNWDYSDLAEEVILQEEPSTTAQSLACFNTIDANNDISITKPGITEQGFQFVYNGPAARDVKIAGDFNDWTPDKGVTTLKTEDGVWKKVINIPSGIYQYKLVIDGKWEMDPVNPNIVSNRFGSYNSLLVID